MIDPSERDEMISAIVQNYIAGEMTSGLARYKLHSCGLNATEIDDLLLPHRMAAFDNFRKAIKKAGQNE